MHTYCCPLLGLILDQQGCSACQDIIRHYHSADHDHIEYYCQEISSKSFLCDSHGPLCVCLLHFRLRRTYRVRHTALLCQQQKAECQKGQEEEESAPPALFLKDTHGGHPSALGHCHSDE